MSKPTSKTKRDNKHIEEPDALGLERIVFFSDAVFAIAITLLALEIRLPEGMEIHNDTQLFQQLTGIWHQYLGFLISFLVIGMFWMAHHRKFNLIKRYDNRLITLNILLLMVIAFVPFPSSILIRYSQRTATVFYALTMVLAGLLMIWLWRYASHRHHLIDPALDEKQIRRQFISPLTTITIFLLSIVIAFMDSGLARLSWILLLPASLYANQKQSL